LSAKETYTQTESTQWMQQLTKNFSPCYIAVCFHYTDNTSSR